jgi:hypothetical protein
VNYTVQGVGNLLVLGGFTFNNTNAAGALGLIFSDNGSTPNSYTSCGTSDYDGGHLTTGMAFCIAKTAATITFTLTPSATSYCSITIAEYSLTGGTSVSVDGYATAHGSGTAVSVGAITTTGSSDLVACVVSDPNTTSHTAGTGWTRQVNLINGSDEPGAYEDQQNVAAGSYTGTWTIGTSPWSAVVCGFTVTSAGGASPYWSGCSILRPVGLTTIDLYPRLE